MKYAHIIFATSITGLLLIAGCMSRETDRTLSTDHPAHPQAKEAPFTPPSNLLAEPDRKPLHGDEEVHARQQRLSQPRRTAGGASELPAVAQPTATHRVTAQTSSNNATQGGGMSGPILFNWKRH